ncbi:hypothetical protein ACFYO8_15370 [Micromonospora sp. NPDC005257]|uniref:restriction endonuclease subunit S n=1 Tax=unclassified Micromonospora TaxID=2617518 RepID=UPI0033B8CC08
MTVPFVVPESWVWGTLGDVVSRVEAGKSFTCLPRPAEDGEWGVIKVSAMTWGEFRATENKAVPEGAAVDSRFEIRPGDVLVSRANTEQYVGAPVLVGPCRPGLLLSDKSLRLVPAAGIDRTWLLYALSSPFVRHQISMQASGQQDSMRNISQKALLATPLPIPPRDEQRRIVAALEEKLSRLAEAERRVASPMRRLPLLRSAIIGHMIRSSKASPRTLESLLLVKMINGKSVPTRAGGFPVLRLTALRDGRIDLDESKHGAWDAAAAAPFVVRGGDFLVSRGNGSLRLVGQGGLVPADPDPVAFPDTLIRVRTDPSQVRAEYLALVWNSRYVRRQIEASARTTAGIFKINQALMAKVEIPVPELSDQDDILLRWQMADGGLRRLRAVVDSAARRAAALRLSLLTEAFAGRLVPQGDDDESAQELLARIRAERKIAGPKQRTEGERARRELVAPPTRVTGDDYQQEALPL